MHYPAKPKKSLGQNFMTDERELAGIAEALGIERGETVLEIGPGPGALTKALLVCGARVIAIEKDPKLAHYLNGHYRASPPVEAPVRVICDDILKVDLKSLHLTGPIKVIGNIPYNITSPIIEWLIEERSLITQVVLTVQWEVAERLSAKPGNKDWGSLSVFLQFYADVELLQKIDKSRFFPEPKVDSGVLRIHFLAAPRVTVDEAIFFSLVRRAFQKRRKTLLNALYEKEGPLSKEVLLRALAKVGIDPQRRPETLALADWAGLTDALGSDFQK